MSINRFLRSPWAIPEVIPLVVPIVGGLTGATYMGYKHLVYNRDVIIYPKKYEGEFLTQEPSNYRNFVSNRTARRNLQKRL